MKTPMKRDDLPPLEPMFCPGCKNEINPNVCWCGDYMNDHVFCNDHSAVPMGCDCGRVGLTL